MDENFGQLLRKWTTFVQRKANLRIQLPVIPSLVGEMPERNSVMLSGWLKIQTFKNLCRWSFPFDKLMLLKNNQLIQRSKKKFLGVLSVLNRFKGPL